MTSDLWNTWSAAVSQTRVGTESAYSLGIYRWQPHPQMETPISDLYLPSEILDYILDFLEDDIETLMQCCLVSKSWVPRARKHIYAVVVFEGLEDLQSWKETFPDLANSPSYHTHILVIGCNPGFRGESGWIQGFPHVEQVMVECEDWTDPLSFQKLAPSLKALAVHSSSLPLSQIFDLIRSLPLLEVLALGGSIADDDADDYDDDYDDGDGENHDHNHDHGGNGDESDEPRAVVSSNSPALSETLQIQLTSSVGRILSGLLGLPGGLRFRDLKLAWCRKPDMPHAVELVGMCSNTLEYLDIGCRISGMLDPL